MRLLQMSFSGAALILAIVILRALAIHRLPKKTFFALWGVVLIRLLCPFTIPSPYSAYTLAETLLPTRNELAAQTPGATLLPETLPAAPALSPAAETPHTLSLWMILWLAGALACALFFLISGIRCSREFRTSLPAGNAYTQRWLEAHPLRRTIEIRQSDRIAAPLTYGVLHPVILMPKTTDWTDEASLHYILTHEYVHIRRFDTATKRIAAAALCLHWFNPLVWVMYFLLNRDMELACDESVVRRTGEQRRASYAHMLIRMEAKKSGLLPFCSNFSKNATEERIRAIMTMKKTTAGAAAISVMVILILAVLFATSRDSGSPQPVVPDTPDMDHAAALIKAVSEDSITVDPVEFITSEDTERIRELNLQEYDMPDGYYILNEKPETVVWKCDKNTVFTFIDWHAHFTGLKHPEEYTTTDIREFEFYIRHDYNDGEDFNYSPRLPFFFTSRNGAIQKVLEIPIA